MSDYTPTTEQVRNAWLFNVVGAAYAQVPERVRDAYRAEFDRWLERVEQAAYERGLADGKAGG